MAFLLYSGNDGGRMAEKLYRLLREEGRRKGDPFAEPVVVVQDKSLCRWLGVKLAEADGRARGRCNGICPAIDWCTPGDFLYRFLFNPMRGLTPTRDASTFVPAVNAWTLYGLLGKPFPGDAPPAGYIGADGRMRDLKRWQLARRLAELFDRYMTYRPGLLESWERAASTDTLPPEEAWQAALWRSLATSPETGRPRADTFAACCRAYLSERTAPSAKTMDTERTFVFFGIPFLPEIHLRCLEKFARTADLHFFMVNPGTCYLPDVRTEKAQLREAGRNGALALRFDEAQHDPLLASLGKSAMGIFSLMERHDAFASVDDTYFFEFPAVPGTLLQRVRRNIQENPPERPPRDVLPDESLAIHACHSALRELEVLRDALVRAFDTPEHGGLPGLAPKDVRVYLPDVAAYAPFIDAVFGGGESPRLPYAVLGRSLAANHPECAAFLKLVLLLDSRYAAPDVADLLAAAPVAAHFGLDAEDCASIPALLVAAHAAWGLDAAQKSAEGGLGAERNSWSFARDRLLFGVACPDFAPERPSLRLPSGGRCRPEATAENCAKAVGVIAEAVARFDEAQRFLRDSSGYREHAAEEWAEFLRTLADAFLGEDDGGDGLFTIRRMIDKLVCQHDWTRVERVGAEPGPSGAEPVRFTFPVLKSWVAGELSPPAERVNPVSGKITFCPFPRNGVVLPARVVAVAGMNDGAFPARRNVCGFDLMARDARPGDPDPRAQDRYAFLLALLSARDRFIATYTGRDERSNKEQPPSILLAELARAAEAHLAPAEDGGVRRIVRQEALNPFSEVYFDGSAPRSYSRRNLRIAEARRGAAAELQGPDVYALDGEAPGSVTLDDLCAFFAAPAKTFLKKSVGAEPELRDKAALDGYEPFAEDPLRDYKLRKALLDRILRENRVDREALQRDFDNLLEDGGFPPSLAAEPILDELEELYGRLADAAGGDLDVAPAPPRACSFRLPADGIAFTATLRGVRETAKGCSVLDISPSKDSQGKHRAGFLLRHLAQCASGEAPARFVGVLKGMDAVVYGPVPRTEALRLLSAFCDVYRKGMQKAVCFDPGVYFNCRAGKTHVFDRGRIAAKWAHSEYQRGADETARRIFGEHPSPADEQVFADVAGLFEEATDLCREGL